MKKSPKVVGAFHS